MVKEVGEYDHKEHESGGVIECPSTNNYIDM